MENIKIDNEKVENINKDFLNKKRNSLSKWTPGILLIGSILAFSKRFSNSLLDEFIIMVIAIGSGCFFHKLKRRLKIKNNILSNIATYFILLMISASLIGGCTRIADMTNKNALISGATRVYFIDGLTSECISSASTGNVPIDKLKRYCSCVANGTADITTIQESQSNPASQAYKDRVVQIANGCLE